MRGAFLLLAVLGCAEGRLEAVLDGGAGPGGSEAPAGQWTPDVGAPPASGAPGEVPGEAPGAQPQATPPAGNSPQVGSVPCGVQRILESGCMECHDSEPRFGAPMALRTLADLHAPARSEPARAVYELVLDRVSHETSPMPPPPNAPLSAEQIATLQGWVADGAPAGAGCAEPQAEQPEQPADSLPSEEEEPPAPEETPADCDYDIELRAHFGNNAADDAPYRVPLERDHYECFYFRMPWNGDAHGLTFSPLVDDDRVLHHWLLYVQEGTVFTDGDHDACAGRHENASLVAGWAPGGSDNVMPPDVGMHLPSGQTHMFVLELHYNNAAGHRDALDRSGVHICATEQLRPNTAGMQWLGTERILLGGAGRHEVTGRCRPRLQGPVTILSSSPHMHRRGRHLRTEIRRASGGSDVLIDAPFDFANQVIHPTPETIFPGDELLTTSTRVGWWGSGRGPTTRCATTSSSRTRTGR